MNRNDERREIEARVDKLLTAARQYGSLSLPSHLMFVLNSLWAREHGYSFVFDPERPMGFLKEIQDSNGSIDEKKVKAFLVNSAIAAREIRESLNRYQRILSDKYGIDRFIGRIVFFASEYGESFISELGTVDLRERGGSGEDRRRYKLDEADLNGEGMTPARNADGLVHVLRVNLGLLASARADSPDRFLDEIHSVGVAHEYGHGLFHALATQLVFGGMFAGNLIKAFQNGVDHPYFTGLQFDFEPFGYDGTLGSVDGVVWLTGPLQEAHAWWVAARLTEDSSGRPSAALAEDLDHLAGIYLDMLNRGADKSDIISRRASVVLAVVKAFSLPMTDNLRQLDALGQRDASGRYQRLVGAAGQDGALVGFVKGISFKYGKGKNRSHKPRATKGSSRSGYNGRATSKKSWGPY